MSIHQTNAGPARVAPRWWPTGTCFDDALDLLGEVSGLDLRDPLLEQLFVMHAICLEPRNGEPIAHAWVETSDGQVLFYGFELNGGPRVIMVVPVATFCEVMRPQLMTRYRALEAIAENHRTGHFGPWLDMYGAFTLKRGSMR